MTVARSSPSGVATEVDNIPATALLNQSPVWNGTIYAAGTVPTRAAVVAAGQTLVAPLTLQLLGAGHTPGLYALMASAIVRTVATAGTMTRTFGFNTPLFGAAVMALTGTPLTVLGNPNGSINTFAGYSDGTAPIVVTFTRVGVTGNPVIDLTANARLVGH